ncbi:MAG: ABC transporter ATP-binding protein [Eubacteriaceae bacterium]
MSFLLEVSDLTKEFGGLKATNRVNFKINSNRIISIIGPNGAGKTTLFNLLSGFIKPTSGKIIFDGKNITKLEPHQIADLGLIRTFQSTETFKGLTVLESVIAGSHRINKPDIFGILTNMRKYREQEKKCKEKAIKIIRYFKLEKYMNTVSNNLPYGKQKVLEIVIALAAEPKLLLLDEPVVGLNPSEKIEIIKLIKKINLEQNLTILFVEHDMNIVMDISYNILVLNAGELIAEGPPVNIKKNNKVIEAYLGYGVKNYVRS